MCCVNEFNYCMRIRIIENIDDMVLRDFISNFSSDRVCDLYLEYIRWRGDVVSPYVVGGVVYLCGNGKYKCGVSGRYFTYKTGTFLNKDKVGTMKWFYALWMYYNVSDLGVKMLSKTIKVSTVTASRMIGIIRNSGYSSITEFINNFYKID